MLDDIDPAFEAYLTFYKRMALPLAKLEPDLPSEVTSAVRDCKDKLNDDIRDYLAARAGFDENGDVFDPRALPRHLKLDLMRHQDLMVRAVLHHGLMPVTIAALEWPAESLDCAMLNTLKRHNFWSLVRVAQIASRIHGIDMSPAPQATDRPAPSQKGPGKGAGGRDGNPGHPSL